MKKRYIVEAEAKIYLPFLTLDAITELGSSKIITNEDLHFRNLDHISVMLDEEEVTFLKSKGLNPSLEVVAQNILLASNYERIFSLHHKTIKKNLDGSGVKVGVLDTGCNNFATFNVEVANVKDGYNFITNSENWVDGFGHGTRVCSIVKRVVAPGCDLYALKTISDEVVTSETAILAALDFAIDEELDFLNLSWTFFTPSIGSAIDNVIASGTVICAASGNNTEDFYTLLPASYPGVIAVNAITEARQPVYKNIIPMPDIIGSHGVDVACGGWATEQYNVANAYVNGWGSSFACPFFVGALALYKQELQESDNNKVVQYALKRAKKTDLPQYFGSGIISF
jgi:subtilisin family serine protease